MFILKYIYKKTQLNLFTGSVESVLAERVGFEPTVRFWRTHDFQSCSFDPSDISPCAGRLWYFARPLVVDNVDYYIILFSVWQLKIAYCADFFLVNQS